MARKSAVLLKSTPVKLDKTARVHIAQIEKFVPVEGCEDHWQHYVNAVRVHAEEEARWDAITRLLSADGKEQDSKHWPAFVAQGARVDQTMKAQFGAYDSYQYRVRHKDDKVGVPEPEVRAVVIDTLAEGVEDMQFSINHGMLGSKVAQAIRKDTSEGESVEPPLCIDCQDE
jgi:hypothetical protein